MPGRHPLPHHARPAGPARPSRLQPNHPTDDPRGIAASILDGLLYGCGDAVIGINPATDSIPAAIALLELLDDVRQRYDIPTQSCVLAHVTTTLAAIERGAPVDLVFQSVAGTEAANRGFGVDLAVLAEAHDAALVAATAARSATTSCTSRPGRAARCRPTRTTASTSRRCEARAYAVARRFEPLLVNTVVGFIGPEYLYDGKQIIRAGLEDHFCGKLLGLPMGVRRLLHQPRRGRPGRHGHPADAARRGRLHLRHGRAGRRRRDAATTSRTSFHDALYVRAGARAAAGAGVRGLARADGPARRRPAGSAQLAPRSPSSRRLVATPWRRAMTGATGASTRGRCCAAHTAARVGLGRAGDGAADRRGCWSSRPRTPPRGTPCTRPLDFADAQAAAAATCPTVLRCAAPPRTGPPTCSVPTSAGGSPPTAAALRDRARA